MSQISRLVSLVPHLPRPLVLLEDGRGQGASHLVWGATRRHRVDWSDAEIGGYGSLDGFVRETPVYGTLAYEAGSPAHATRHAPMIEHPLADFFEPENRIVLHGDGRLDLHGRDAADAWAQTSRPASGLVPSGRLAVRPSGRPRRTRSFERLAFEAAVERAKEYIAAGDIYQANLSVAELYAGACDAWTAYQALRELNPSPWMGFADFGDWQLVSGSPELLVEWLPDGMVRARPIAGTRKKTRDADADAKMRLELQLDEKERAEHLMLVDLARNDLGRVAAFHSVRVTEREVIEEYSHVFHLVSEVQGTLEPGGQARDVVEAMFPGGTITGCPKIRSMEIIAELEPVARGLYTGALGWLSTSAMQLNIVIRSAVCRDAAVVIQAGAGIVWDSVPEREWKESLRKAEAVRMAFGVNSEQ